MIAPEPDFALHADEIQRRLGRAAMGVSPEDFRGLMGDAGLAMLRITMESVEADSISIWLADLQEANLIVTHTEPDPAFIGWSQPIHEGLISLAYVSEQSLCENQVYLHVAHSKRADAALGQITCAMLATPFYFGGAIQGVVSAVQLKTDPSDPDPGGFSARHLNRVRRLSTVLERLVNYRLLTGLLGIEL